MRTLSVRQPWAWLIAQGIKPVENRDWTTSYRGPLLIHAGVTMARTYYDDVRLQLASIGFAGVLPAYEALQRGGVVARATLVDVVEAHSSPFFVGPYAWVLRDVHALPFVPWKGQLGFFDVPAHAVGLQPEMAP